MFPPVCCHTLAPIAHARPSGPRPPAAGVLMVVVEGSGGPVGVLLVTAPLLPVPLVMSVY